MSRRTAPKLTVKIFPQEDEFRQASDFDSKALPFADKLWSRTGHNINAIEVPITIAQIINPDSDVKFVKDEIERLAKCATTDDVCKLIDVMRDEGYGVDGHEVKGFEPYLIDIAMKKKILHPSLRTLLIVAVAKKLKLRAWPVNLGPYTLAIVRGQVIDGFTYEIIPRSSLSGLANLTNSTVTSLLRRSPNESIAIRLIDSIIDEIDWHSDPTLALKMIDYKQVVLGFDIEVIWQRADIWLELGENALAREVLQNALSEAQSPDVKEFLLDRLAEVYPDAMVLN